MSAPAMLRRKRFRGSMQIGFSVNEMLFLVTLATGACWVVWKLRLRQGMAAVDRKPLWVTFGAEMFVVVGLMFSCRIAVADWPRVPSGSMEPTLRVGDYLLVNHLAYGPRLPFTNTAIELGQPQRGDVVVFRYPLDVSQFYVKRLVGLPGDEVVFRDGGVSVNDEPFDLQLQGEGNSESDPPEDRGHWILQETLAGHQHQVKVNPFVQGRLPMDALAPHCRSPRPGAWLCSVPAGHYLMLGDNRDNSTDSRAWGFLPHEQVYGKAVRVLFNLNDWSRRWKAL